MYFAARLVMDVGGNLITQILLLLWEERITAIPARLPRPRARVISSQVALLCVVTAYAWKDNAKLVLILEQFFPGWRRMFISEIGPHAHQRKTHALNQLL